MKSQQEFRSSLCLLGTRIYQLRIIKGFTTKKIASEMNLSAEAWRNIEKGICDLPITKLLHIAAILGIEAGELLRV